MLFCNLPNLVASRTFLALWCPQENAETWQGSWQVHIVELIAGSQDIYGLLWSKPRLA